MRAARIPLVAPAAAALLAPAAGAAPTSLESGVLSDINAFRRAHHLQPLRAMRATALQLWLASPEHRANLMNPRWRENGVAAVHEAAAPGVYEGRRVTIVTTDFGVRR